MKYRRLGASDLDVSVISLGSWLNYGVGPEKERSLAWVLREPNVASAIVGASRPEQIADNAGAAELSVDPALFAQASRIAAEVPPFRP